MEEAEPEARRDATVRGAHWATAALFAINGALWGSVVPRLPEIKAAATLSDGAYGAGIGAFSIGALLAGLAAGWLVARFGSGSTAAASALVAGAVLATPALAGAWLPFAAAMLMLGALDALMDAAMNTHGLRVQRARGRSVLHAMHAWWSIGAIAGGASGALAAAAGIAPLPHLLAAGIVLAGVAAVCWPRLLAVPAPADAPARPPLDGTLRLRRLPAAVAGIGIVLVLAAVVEDAPASWSGVHLREDLGVAHGLAGVAYVAFLLAMTASRLVGDRLIDRFGARSVVRASALTAAVGLGAGLAIDTPWAIVLAFALVGIGAAPAFPAAFQAAEHLPGISPAAGVAAVTLVGRGGFLLAPLLVGALAEVASLRVALLVPVAAAVLVAVAARAVRGAGPKSISRAAA